jgi:sugar phosphate isomerase/epimerase
MTIDRRAFLTGAGGLAAVACLGGIGNLAAAAKPRKLGLQLYTVREIFAADPVGTLEQVARIGYREVEYGGGNYDRMDHAMLRRTMDKLQLTAPSVHIPYDMLLNDFAGAETMAKTLGAETIVVPWLPADQRSDEAFAAVVTNVGRFARQAHDAGFGLAYHNHDFEFAPRPDGTMLYDRLLSGTDPALVKLELDLYWAIYAGQDAKALISRLGSRLYAFHVKDMRADRKMTAVGTGTIDFQALFKLPGAAGVRHFYVEDDEAPAPYIPDIATSFKNLRALRF